MAKAVTSFELNLHHRRSRQPLTNWLYTELQNAILEGRLRAGTKLPGSRDFADQYNISRGTVVNVFERLLSEGYLSSRIGAGTWVSRGVRRPEPARLSTVKPPEYIRKAIAAYKHPKPFRNWVMLDGRSPFRMAEPALSDFPAKLWGRLVARRARSFHSWVQTPNDRRGYKPLRDTLAQYLSTSRGVRCHADQIVLTSGVQQALSLLARFLLQPGDPVWMEDPGYFGASIAFNNAGAQIIPVPVDDEGLSVDEGMKLCAHAKGAYLTPGHQYPLGATMSLGRRIEMLRWARRVGAFIIEDDYDSEYRFEGRPVPVLQSLDKRGNVIFVGTFTKLLFPSLRLGYVVLPTPLVDCFLAYRNQSDFWTLSMDQAVLCDFIAEGHLGRHLRRMRNLYADRLTALIDAGQQYLKGLLDVSQIRAGLYTCAFLRNGMTSRQAETAAMEHGVETRALDRFTLKCPDPKGLLLGFASFEPKTIRQGVIRLAAALEKPKFVVRR
jgi:GntR family transcriptional regulator/MocR family aminotransferase